MAFDLMRGARAALILAGLLALLVGSQAFARTGVHYTTSTTPPAADPTYTAAVEQCATATVQAERSVTFTAQMGAIVGTQRMGVRFELQQRLRGESEFHTVLASGLDDWHSSEEGVQIYKYVKQVTNLEAPAAYRAIVHFRWTGEKGRVLKRAEARTTRCVQPPLPGQVTQTPSAPSI